MIATGLITTIGQSFGIPEVVISKLVEVAAAFLIGQGLADFGAQGLIPAGHPAKNQSSKFLAYVASTLIIAIGSYFSVEESMTTWLAHAVSAFLLGQGVADMGQQGLRKLDEIRNENKP